MALPVDPQSLTHAVAVALQLSVGTELDLSFDAETSVGLLFTASALGKTWYGVYDCDGQVVLIPETLLEELIPRRPENVGASQKTRAKRHPETGKGAGKEPGRRAAPGKTAKAKGSGGKG